MSYTRTLQEQGLILRQKESVDEQLDQLIYKPNEIDDDDIAIVESSAAKETSIIPLSLGASILLLPRILNNRS